MVRELEFLLGEKRPREFACSAQRDSFVRELIATNAYTGVIKTEAIKKREVQIESN